MEEVLIDEFDIIIVFFFVNSNDLSHKMIPTKERLN